MQTWTRGAGRDESTATIPVGTSRSGCLSNIRPAGISRWLPHSSSTCMTSICNPRYRRKTSRASHSCSGCAGAR